MSIRCLIVDDEDLARDILREYLAGEEGIEVVGECTNGFDAVKAVAQHKPDLLFLDVQMPKLDGFEVLELIGPTVAVIFVTAYDQYATKAFDAAAVDYLLKPFDQERFRTALARARQRIASSAPPPDPVELRNAVRNQGQYLQRIVFKDGTKIHLILSESIDYVEAQDDYLAIHANGKTYLKQQTISSLESSLDPAQFVRTHRSFLVNLNRVKNIEPYTKDTRLAVLTDGTKVPVSRAGNMRLRELLGEN
jgi:two-component system, LytTR family, response regulator